VRLKSWRKSSAFLVQAAVHITGHTHSALCLDHQDDRYRYLWVTIMLGCIQVFEVLNTDCCTILHLFQLYHESQSRDFEACYHTTHSQTFSSGEQSIRFSNRSDRTSLHSTIRTTKYYHLAIVGRPLHTLVCLAESVQHILNNTVSLPHPLLEYIYLAGNTHY